MDIAADWQSRNQLEVVKILSSMRLSGEAEDQTRSSSANPARRSHRLVHDTLKARVSALELEREALRERLKKALTDPPAAPEPPKPSPEVESLRQELSALRQEASQKLSEAEGCAKSLDEQLACARGDNESMAAALSVVQSHKEALSGQVASLREDMNALRAGFQSELSSLRQSEAEQGRQRQDLLERFMAVQRELGETALDAARAKSRADQLQADKDRMSRETEALRAELAPVREFFQRELDAVRERARHQQEQRDALQAQVARLQDELAGLRAVAARNEADALRAELRSAKEEQERQLRESRTLGGEAEAEKQRLAAELAAIRAGLEELKRQAREPRAENPAPAEFSYAKIPSLRKFPPRPPEPAQSPKPAGFDEFALMRDFLSKQG